MLELYGKQFASRLLLGTAGYTSPEVLRQAVEASGTDIVTVSLRRESARARAGQGFWELIEKLGRLVLPNTAGCRTAKEAVATAQMARELFGTNWIKLEVIANDDTLQPELFGLVEAATVLCAEGFEVLPYTTEDLSAALHNASKDGIGFLCDCEFPVGGRVLIKLFWHESSALRVPAVVRHTTPHKGVTLVGCEFALDDEEACQAGLKTERWYA